MRKRNIEVEIKIPVSKKILEEVRAKLKKVAKFIGKSTQIDKYFNAPRRDFLKPEHPFEYLRIRIKNDGGEVNYKHIYLDKKGKKTHGDEYETKVKDPKELEKILKALNFKNFIDVQKEREKYVYKNKFEIVLDKVKGLGYFIEIESLKDFGGIKKTKEQIDDFAMRLGVDPLKQENNGYVLLLMGKKGVS